jgi:hypothetical protein
LQFHSPAGHSPTGPFPRHHRFGYASLRGPKNIKEQARERRRQAMLPRFDGNANTKVINIFPDTPVFFQGGPLIRGEICKVLSLCRLGSVSPA